MANKYVVNPTFRLDVDGRLFKEKNDNPDIQDTLVFSELFTRLSIIKGDLAAFPSIGLKQHLFNFGFNTKDEMTIEITAFENDIENQMNRDCVIDVEYDEEDKSVEFHIGVQGLKYPISFKYLQLQNSIKVIHYQFEN